MTGNKMVMTAVTASFLAITQINQAIARDLDKEAMDRIDEAARSVVSSGRAVGLGVGILVDGKLVFQRGYGKANLETSTDVDNQTVFRIASLTKQFTATAIMLLAERGRLSIDDTLATYFPDFPRAKEVTLRELLSHTSGIHNFTEAGALTEGLSCTGATVPVFLNDIAKQKQPYDFTPGTAYHYSNSGYFVLAAIIEKISGVSYKQFLHENIFAPLGMTQTEVDENANVVPHRANGYSPSSTPPEKWVNPGYLSMSIVLSAGSIRSTIKDLATWNQALYGGKLLKPSSLREMTTPAKVADGRTTSAARWNSPSFQPPPPPAYRGFDDYGFGLNIGKFYGHKVIGHSGGIPGFNSMMEYFPEEKIVVISLSNSADGAWKLEESIAGYLVANRPLDEQR